MEYSKIESEHLQKLQENYENYKKAIQLIEDELKAEGSNEDKIENISDCVNELQQVLYYL